jgi:hypothetical protein
VYAYTAIHESIHCAITHTHDQLLEAQVINDAVGSIVFHELMMMVATRGNAETTRTSTSIITVLNTIMTMTMTIIIIVVIATIDDRVSVVIREEGITIAMTITLQVRLGLESIGVFHFTYR